MRFKRYSIGLLCGALLFTGCGEDQSGPGLPGPVQVSEEDFVQAQEFVYTPGSVLETLGLRVDFINPVFGGDTDIPVRNTPQGSGEARQADIEAELSPLGDVFVVPEGGGDPFAINGNVLALQMSRTIPPMRISAFAPNDALLTSEIELDGLVLLANNASDNRIRAGTSFRTAGALPVTQLPNPIDPNIPPSGQLLGPAGETELTLTVENIFVSQDGTNVVLEGTANLRGIAEQVINTVTGEVVEAEPPTQEAVTDANGNTVVVDIPPTDAPTVFFQAGRFSANFVVRQRGIAGPGDDENPLTVLARLHFNPNQAELVYTPTQENASSILYAPSPDRPNVLSNQLVRIERLLNGQVRAEFDPANVSTVLNFTQISPPPGSFPTPIPQLDPGEVGDEDNPNPVFPPPPTTFNYFFSTRTERDNELEEPILLEGFVSTTGPFIFRSLAGAQLGGPFNRSDLGAGLQIGNFNLVFDQDFDFDGSPGTEDDLSGQFFLEQEFPTNDADDASGRIVIIRGFFNGPVVNL